MQPRLSLGSNDQAVDHEIGPVVNSTKNLPALTGLRCLPQLSFVSRRLTWENLCRSGGARTREREVELPATESLASDRFPEPADGAYRRCKPSDRGLLWPALLKRSSRRYRRR